MQPPNGVYSVLSVEMKSVRNNVQCQKTIPLENMK